MAKGFQIFLRVLYSVLARFDLEGNPIKTSCLSEGYLLQAEVRICGCNRENLPFERGDSAAPTICRHTCPAFLAWEGTVTFQ